MSKVLIVEDSLEAFELARRALGSSIQLEWAKNIEQANQILKKKGFDLILLDVTLPDGDGFRLCSMLQASDDLKNIPVIFLTARDSVADKVLGFSVGGDDFVSKPYSPIELKARIDSKLRRREREKGSSQVVRIGDLEINKDTQKVSIFSDGSSTDIVTTPIEFRILLLLASQPNRVFSRDEVLNSVWGEEVHVYSRSVDTHVSKLRKKLGKTCDYIESVHGAGYRLAFSEGDKPRNHLNVGNSALIPGSEGTASVTY